MRIDIRKVILGAGLAAFVAGCASETGMVSDAAPPATGDTAAVEPIPASEVTPPATETQTEKPAALKPAKKKARRAAKAKKQDVIVVATTATIPPEQMPPAPAALSMPQADPVTEAELKQATVQEAEVGIVGFLMQHMLVVISALCLGAIGFYAFVVYPARRNSNNRFG